MNETKSKVYVVQNVMRKHPDGTIRALDYTQAERFGEVIFLFDGQKQVVMSPQPTIRKIIKHGRICIWSAQIDKKQCET